MTRLTDKVRMLFDGTNFAVWSTLEPDGRPHSTVTWVKHDADESAQVQGTASIEDDPDGMLVDELSHKYTGGPYPGSPGRTRNG
jgi:hypothetical protein